jgi:hypothetical protein
LEQGAHDELLAINGLYAKLWSLQSHGFISSAGAEKGEVKKEKEVEE